MYPSATLNGQEGARHMRSSSTCSLRQLIRVLVMAFTLLNEPWSEVLGLVEHRS